MLNSEQDDGEIIILSDEDEFSSWIDTDTENNKINFNNEKKEVELSKDNYNKTRESKIKVEDTKVKEGNEIRIEEKEELVVDDDLFSFDISLDEEEDNNTKKSNIVIPEKKSWYDLNSIIDGTLSDIKIRKEELISEKNDNISEEDFRNSEIKRLKDEIHELKINRATLDTEIKKIDENIVSLWKMKIWTNLIKKNNKI